MTWHVYFPATKTGFWKLEVQLNTQTHQELINTSTCLITPSFCFRKMTSTTKTTKQNQHNHNKNQKHITKYHLFQNYHPSPAFFSLNKKSPRLTALKGAFPFADAASNSGTAPESYLAAFGHSTNGPGKDLGVSKNRGTPKWMVYKGKPGKPY